MGIIVSKAIKLTLAQWDDIQNSMKSDPRIPKSSLLIRDKMKRHLGFTVREHREFVAKMDGGYYGTQIHLDFYNESKRTMFLLRYSDFINAQKETTY